MTATDAPLFQPPEAKTLEETGLPPRLLFDLVLKHAFQEGVVTLARLAQRLKLSPPIIHSIYHQLQKEHLCETRTMVGYDYEIVLSTKGRSMAEVAFQRSYYAGPAPVTLAEYSRSVKAQAMEVQVTAESLRSVLNDLVLPESSIMELGAALVTGGAIVLYGSTGTGKTSIAERLERLLGSTIFMPYAVEVSGQIVTVVDPLIHRAEPGSEMPYSRWVLCRRPMIKVGGELRSEMLDARIDEMNGVCTAPVQMKANNGILLIDDFGRQQITPRELLNRWIVPLDRRTDALSLPSGASFEIPFQVLVVFSTNLALADLAEEAFIRRLKHKIKVEPLNEKLFRELLRRVFVEKGIDCPWEMEDFIVAECTRHSPSGLLASFPIDLMALLVGMAKFEQRAPVLEKAEIERALSLYFVH